MSNKKRLKNLKQFQQPGLLLKEGEENHAHRIRARAEVHVWLRTMNAEQRGALLTRLYDAQSTASVVTPESDHVPPLTVTKLGKRAVAAWTAMQQGAEVRWTKQRNGDHLPELHHPDGQVQRLGLETLAKLEAAGLHLPQPLPE